VRYYTPEKLSDIPGPTRGSSYVTEYDEKTNRIRQWTECYDHFGNVNRVRPKMINGREVFSQHYPATYKDILNSMKGSKWRTLENNVV
jgi:filamentous hemagglutinin